MALVIRPVSGIEECRHIATITIAAWGATPETVVPDHLLITLARNQGIVLLAWDDEIPVGFCFSFVSFAGPERRLKHCSHMTGVIPTYRQAGVGERLKRAQRDAVLAQGIDLITWTYDPLETLNGRLNLHKLGAICRDYRRDVYGEIPDDLNRGLASDRFAVEWWLTSDHVRRCLAGEREILEAAGGGRAGSLPAGAIPLNAWEPGPAGPAPARQHQPPDDWARADWLTVTVPAHFQTMKKNDLALARQWREHSGAIFEAAFAAGFTAVDLYRDGDVCHYLLRRDWRH